MNKKNRIAVIFAIMVAAMSIFTMPANAEIVESPEAAAVVCSESVTLQPRQRCRERARDVWKRCRSRDRRRNEACDRQLRRAQRDCDRNRR